MTAGIVRRCTISGCTAGVDPGRSRCVDHDTGSAPRSISYGGGVQSTAMIVLAVAGQIAADVALFCNVGDDSEHPATIRYVREIAIPWAAERGFVIHELARQFRTGETETLMGRLMKEGSRSLPIPVRMPDTGAPGTRSCTHDFKIAVVGKWLKAHGATPDDPADVLIGISTDEIERLQNRKAKPYETPVYPLIDLGLDRAGCARVIRDAGLPVPPKSACFFCPFHRPATWAEQRRDEPELFWRSVELERTLNRRRDVLGKDHVYLTRFGRPLDEAISVAQDTLPGIGGPETCDSGYCWT
jgi:hypothetical protein